MSSGAGTRAGRARIVAIALSPPIMLSVAMLIGHGLQRLRPLSSLPESLAGTGGVVAGPVVVGLAVLIFVIAFRTVRRVGFEIGGKKPTALLLKSGPYRWSRNPMYLAMIVFMGGRAIWLDNAWLLVLGVSFLTFLRYTVIKKEEAYLERKFTHEYREYKASVRRWL